MLLISVTWRSYTACVTQIAVVKIFRRSYTACVTQIVVVKYFSRIPHTPPFCPTQIVPDTDPRALAAQGRQSDAAKSGSSNSRRQGGLGTMGYFMPLSPFRCLCGLISVASVVIWCEFSLRGLCFGSVCLAHRPLCVYIFALCISKLFTGKAFHAQIFLTARCRVAR